MSASEPETMASVIDVLSYKEQRNARMKKTWNCLRLGVTGWRCPPLELQWRRHDQVWLSPNGPGRFRPRPPVASTIARLGTQCGAPGTSSRALRAGTAHEIRRRRSRRSLRANNDRYVRGRCCLNTDSRFSIVLRKAPATARLTKRRSNRPASPLRGSNATTGRNSNPSGTDLKCRSCLASGRPC